MFERNNRLVASIEVRQGVWKVLCNIIRSKYVLGPLLLATVGLPQNATVTVTALKWRDWQGVELDRREVAQAF